MEKSEPRLEQMTPHQLKCHVLYYEALLAQRDATLEECYQTIAAQRRYIDEQARIAAIDAQLGPFPRDTK